MKGRPNVRSAAFWGEDHVELGNIAVESVGPDCAIAISRGKYPKGYPYLDPNEDAVLVATDGTSSILAVVDGHRGFDAARAALIEIEANAEVLLDSPPSPESALGLVAARARQAVVGAVANETGERSGSRTTVALAVVGSGRIDGFSFGDSRVVVVGPTRSTQVSATGPFLGPGVSADDARFFSRSIGSGSWVLAGTDGLFDFLTRAWPKQLAKLATDADPPEFARNAVSLAFTGGSGDNIAAAVIRVT